MSPVLTSAAAAILSFSDDEFLTTRWNKLYFHKPIRGLSRWAAEPSRGPIIVARSSNPRTPAISSLPPESPWAHEGERLPCAIIATPATTIAAFGISSETRRSASQKTQVDVFVREPSSVRPHSPSCRQSTRELKAAVSPTPSR